jgi:SCO1/SenC
LQYASKNLSVIGHDKFLRHHAPDRGQLGGARAGRPVDAVLITFDPARDDVAALKKMSQQRKLDPAHWTLARPDAASARKIAATLGIQYRQLANGEFNHTTVLILLDADGRIVARTKKLGAVDPAFVKLVHQTLRASKYPKAGHDEARQFPSHGRSMQILTYRTVASHDCSIKWCSPII